MSEDLKAKHRRLIEEGWNKGDMDVLSEIYAANIVRHRPPYPDMVGLEVVKKHVADVHVAVPDWHVAIEEIIAEGNITVMREFWGGTVTGTSPTTGFQGTGQKVKVPNCSMLYWVNGQVVEEWELSAYLGWLQQLGYTITPPEPHK